MQRVTDSEIREFRQFATDHPLDEVLNDHDWLTAAGQSSIFGDEIGAKLATALAAFIAEGRPLSMIRLGDGEGNILASNDQEYPDLYGIGTTKILNLMLGARNSPSRDITRIRRDLVNAITTADILAIPSKGRLRRCYSELASDETPDVRGMIGAINAVRLTRRVAERRGATFQIVTDSICHHELLPHFPGLLSELKSLGLITCYPELAGMLSQAYSIESIESHLIPGQASVDRSARGKHYPEIYGRTLEALSSDCSGRVYIVAAGILGKAYCAQIKHSGGIALDVGSIVEGWVGKKTRRYHTEDFHRKWSLVPAVESDIPIPIEHKQSMLATGKTVRASRMLRKPRLVPRYIQAVTAGRTGTSYISQLLAIVPGVISLHEPSPNYMHSMRRAQHDETEARRFLLGKKIPFINRQTASTYIETSHHFCKGFFEPLIMMDLCPDLMLITREPRRIATSLLAKGAIPARTAAGFQHLVSPDDRNVLSLPGWGRMTDYQLCYWYALEIERRQEHYKSIALHFGRKVVSFSADSVNDYDTFIKVCNDLELSVDGMDLRAQHADVSGVVHNKVRSEGRQQRVEQIDFQPEERQVLEIIGSFEPLLALKYLT
jgi:hypothetical protein